jgi:hypothetical protein
MIVSTEAAGFGSGYCLDRPHSTGAAEVKRRSVMMGSSAPLLFRDARGCEPGLIVGQSVADGHQGRPLTLRAALPARETVHIPSNCRSEGSVCSARRGVRGQEGQRACPLGCQVSFNERVQWACLVRVRAWARTRQRRTAEGRERRNDGVQQRSRDADVFVVGERSGCVGRWKFEWGSDSGVGSEQWAGLTQAAAAAATATTTATATATATAKRCRIWLERQCRDSQEGLEYRKQQHARSLPLAATYIYLRQRSLDHRSPASV